MLVLFASASVVTLADANRTSMKIIFCVYTVLRYSWRWAVELSETCRVLYWINLRNSAPRWLSLSENGERLKHTGKNLLHWSFVKTNKIDYTGIELGTLRWERSDQWLQLDNRKASNPSNKLSIKCWMKLMYWKVWILLGRLVECVNKLGSCQRGNSS